MPGTVESKRLMLLVPASVASLTLMRLTEGEASARGAAWRVSTTTVSGNSVGVWAMNRAKRLSTGRGFGGY